MFTIQNELDLKIGVEVYHFVGKIGLKCECYMVNSRKECNVPEFPKDRDELIADPHKFQWNLYEIVIRVYGEKYSFKGELINSELLFIETPILQIDILRDSKYPRLIVKPSAPFQATLETTMNIAKSTKDQISTPVMNVKK